MNNQQWPTPGQQSFGQPQWTGPQSPAQPSGQLYSGNAPTYNAPSQPLSPAPGASQPFGYPSGALPPFNGQEARFAERATSFPPGYMPPPAAGKLPIPKKRGFLRKRVAVPVWAIILTALVMFGLLGVIISQSSSAGNGAPRAATSSSASSAHNTNTPQPTAAPTQAPTPTPTHTPKWTNIQTFTGNGMKQTQTFTVGSDWKVIWSCDPSSFYGGQYNVIVYVYNSDGTPADVAVNTVCKAGNTSNSTEEHQGGSIYLEIDSEGSWKVQVQELQ